MSQNKRTWKSTVCALALEANEVNRAWPELCEMSLNLTSLIFVIELTWNMPIQLGWGATVNIKLGSAGFLNFPNQNTNVELSIAD